jgi:hypothetical protein
MYRSPIEKIIKALPEFDPRIRVITKQVSENSPLTTGVGGLEHPPLVCALFINPDVIQWMRFAYILAPDVPFETKVRISAYHEARHCPFTTGALGTEAQADLYALRMMRKHFPEQWENAALFLIETRASGSRRYDLYGDVHPTAEEVLAMVEEVRNEA